MASATASAAPSTAPVFSREIRGTLGTTTAADEVQRCEIATNAVVLYGGQPAITLTRAERAPGLHAWVRSPTRAVVVVETEGGDEAGPECSEAAAEGAITSITLPATEWTAARIYVRTRTGSTAPFVAGVTTARELPATEPAAIAAPAADEVRVRWRSIERDPCNEGPCADLALELTGALTQTVRAPSELRPEVCSATANLAPPAVAGFACSGGGFDTVTLVSRGGGRYEVRTTHQSDGACGGPCPTARAVLTRFTAPATARLVPHPAGALAW